MSNLKFIVDMKLYKDGKCLESNDVLHSRRDIVLVPECVIEDGIKPEDYAVEWVEFLFNEEWSGDVEEWGGHLVADVRQYTEFDWLTENNAPMLFGS